MEERHCFIERQDVKSLTDVEWCDLLENRDRIEVEKRRSSSRRNFVDGIVVEHF